MCTAILEDCLHLAFGMEFVLIGNDFALNWGGAYIMRNLISMTIFYAKVNLPISITSRQLRSQKYLPTHMCPKILSQNPEIKPSHHFEFHTFYSTLHKLGSPFCPSFGLRRSMRLSSLSFVVSKILGHLTSSYFC